jgi:sugar phosphate isomerase/epimerase
MADTNLPTFGAAVDLIRAVGHPRAGLAVDIYQLARSGDDDFALLPALLEGVPVAVVELGTRPWTPTWSDRAASRAAGDLDMAGFVAAMIDAGWTGFWGVEIIADELRALPVAQGLSEVRAGVDVALARAQETLEARS